MKQDLLVWKNFLEQYNSKSFFLDYRWLSNNVLQLFSDAASTIGYGVVFGNRWLQGLWEPECLGLNIAVLEFYPILLALLIWAEELRDKSILLRSDNMAVVCVINNNTTKDKTIMILVRKLVLLCLKYNILVKSKHIPGKQNVISDLLSRSQVERAKLKAPYMDREATPVPQKWQLHRLLMN